MIRLLKEGMQNVYHGRDDSIWGARQEIHPRPAQKSLNTRINNKENAFKTNRFQPGEISSYQKLKFSFYNAKGQRTSDIFSLHGPGSQNLRLSLPVRGPVLVTSEFGEDRGDYLHQGIDFDGKKGDPIYSAAGGKVIYAGYSETAGNEIIIQHSDNVLTRYAHLDEIHIKEGQVVGRGEVIGTMGSTGTVYAREGVAGGDGFRRQRSGQ